ncbi:hypothetical protein CDLVIII_0649 [Clostridium sp. DL-VIII]|uniref:hypothetical protein n=1 Tax=Clostridium sp. DL-VIII TaxID=641107 RepID=UPI00023AF67F|nr:hypothetical protein [Clostridium sp. DL-VIII]EHI97375.1 hypothetical protein CDLVIII_0649 [Clostridium sp. DL-VIII]
MCKIYKAPIGWNPTRLNPFTTTGYYGKEWSVFIYDEEIRHHSNIYENTRVYVVQVNPEVDSKYERLFDYLTYETKHRRNVILSLPKHVNFDEVLKMFDNFHSDNEFRESDGKYLVHSTTKESWESIKKSGVLLSPNKLKKQGISILEIGLKPMLEPDDYSDYVMLDVLEGCGELVVNSRQLGSVCITPDIKYIPGVRIYFDAELIIKDGLGTRDGLHILKIKDRLPLDKYLLDVISAESFQKKEWTPTTFTNEANRYFLEGR